MRWGLAEFHPHAAIASSFGAEDVALIDIAARVRAGHSRVHAGHRFPVRRNLRTDRQDREEIRHPRRAREIAATRRNSRPRNSRRNSGPSIRTSAAHCAKSSRSKPSSAGLSAWVTGIRRDQAPTRANAKKIEWDKKFGLVKCNPLADWTWENVWEYIRDHDVPYNPLHEQNYPSIGCVQCTRQVQPGEDPRAGRWSGFAKKECGLHAPGVSARLSVVEFSPCKDETSQC